MRRGLLLCIPILLTAFTVAAQEPVDLEMITHIRDEGFHRSQVMQTLRHLTEDIGPRLTGSLAMNEANAWTLEKLESWGLVGAHLEGFEFGRGWSFSRCAVHAIEPIELPLLALPQAWTPGTEGPVRAEAVYAKIETEDDLDAFRGQLQGKIVLVDAIKEVEPAQDPLFDRYDDPELDDLCTFPVPAGPNERLEKYKEFLKRMDFINVFLLEEEALAKVQISSRDAGVLRVTRGASQDPAGQQSVTGLAVAVEHYNKLARWLESGKRVELEIDIQARFYTEDSRGYNTVAEIRGRKKKDEVVLIGAHLDSWHAGTGATDNGSGVAVMMEVMRILQAVEAPLDRTVRIALWSGEEQGLFGSRAYVADHLATRPPVPEEQRTLHRVFRDETWPITPKAAFEDFSAYFNLDNGAGRIRGIYAEGNAAARPIFEAWLEPFADLGADRVTLQSTRGTDHLSFVEVGLPGFQFVQDPMAYTTRTHHTNLDVIDHIVEEDLKQAAVIIASFVFHAANRDEKLPRPRIPQAPPETESEKGAEVATSEKEH